MFDIGFPSDWSTLKKLIWIVKSTGGEKLVTIIGELVSFIAKSIVPIKGLKVDIESNQAGSGDPSPSNVRTVSGWTGCNVYQSGGNLIDVDTATVYNRYINVSGNEWKSASDSRSYAIPCDANSQYKISHNCGAGIFRVCYIKLQTIPSTNVSINAYGIQNIGITSNQTIINTGAGATFVIVQLSGQYIDNKNSSISVEKIENVYSFDWSNIAGTIYGGYYDILNGDLMSNVRRTRMSGTSTWYRQQINGQYYFCRSVDVYGIKNKAVACTHFKPMPTASALGSNPDCSIQLAVGRYYQMNIRYDAITTTSAFQQFLKDNEVYFFYEGGTPTHYDLGATSDYADFGEADSMTLTE